MLVDQPDCNEHKNQKAWKWQVTVFCHNERSRIAECLASIVTAIGSYNGLITVILNGSTDGSEAAVLSVAANVSVPIRIARISYADKSNAINCALYDLREDAELYFFVDGYVTISPNSLQAMSDRLSERIDVIAASGVASNGRSKPQSAQYAIEARGILQGQFHALRPDFIRRMVDSGIRLPIGLYRGDGLLGSMVMHDLDAVGQPWVNDRAIVVAEATFKIDALSPLHWRDLKRQFRRKIRQMRGRLENEAIKQVIYRGGYKALPSFADDIIHDFLATHPAPKNSIFEKSFMIMALRQHRSNMQPDIDDLRPSIVAMK